MPHKYDAATKFLLNLDPAAWAEFFGVPCQEVQLLDSDFSTVTVSGDGALFIKSDENTGLHVEFQSSYFQALAERTLFHNRLFHKKYGLCAKSVIVLLQPHAAGSHLSGVYEEKREDEVYLLFLYDVLKLWEIPAERFLKARLALLPLAPLSNVSKKEMHTVIAHLKRRFSTEASPQLESELWTSVEIFLGLRYKESEKAEVEQLLRGVTNMRESFTYQAILREGHEEGLIEGEKKFFILFASKRLGEPDEKAMSDLVAVKTEAELNTLADRLEQVETWHDLFQSDQQ